MSDSKSESVNYVDHGVVKDHSHHIEGNILLVDQAGAVRRVPAPTDSPLDPLNFSTWRKAGIFFCCVWFAIMALSVVGGFGALIGTFFGQYAQQGVPPDEIARLLTWPSLFTGVANFVMLPISLVVGRRPIFLFASLLLIASSVWAAKSLDSFHSHLAARIVQGFAAGATESVLPLIITDMTFISERSRYYGLYWSLQSILTAVLNTASSYEAVNLKPEWYYWIFAILACIGAVAVIFLLPETRFERPAFAIDGQVTKVDEFGNMVVLSDEEAAAALAQADEERRLAGEKNEQFSYVKSLNPFVKPAANGFGILTRCYYDMARSLLDPAILYALGASSVVLGLNIAISLSFGGILGKEYGWPTQNTGLIYLGALPASIFSYICVGWGGDKINLWLARRNNGLHLPEHRLPALLFPCITGVPLAIAYGLCASAAPKVHWFSIVFTMNYATFFFVAVLIVTTTYAVEAMTHHSGAALVMVVGGKNLISFGLSTAIVPLVNGGRYAYAYGILAAPTGAWLLLGIPLYYLMPRYRAWRDARKA